MEKNTKSFDDIKQLTDKTLNIKILVKDFARNTTVKEFILNKDTGEVSELKPQMVTVTIQNGKEMSSQRWCGKKILFYLSIRVN